MKAARRRWMRPLLAVALFALSVEAACWIGLALLTDGDFEHGLRQVAEASVDWEEVAARGASGKTDIHPYLGFLPVPVPDRRQRVKKLDYVQINQASCYGAWSPLFSEDPQDLIVAIAGGSVARSFAGGGREEFALGLAASFPGREVRYVVLAFAGGKQPQQLMALTYMLALGGRIDLLINLDGYNELALHELENHQQGVGPSYPRAWFFRAQRVEILPLLGEQARVDRARQDAASAAFESPWWWSRAFRLRVLLGDRARARESGRVEQELRAFAPAQNRNIVLSGPPSRGGTTLERLDELTELWKTCSLQLDRICRANGIEYFHLLQPNQYVEGSKTLSAEELAGAYRPDKKYALYVPDSYSKLELAGRELIELGVNFHSLSGVFQDVQATVYIDTCCHVNELGNSLMARAIAEFIGASR